MGPLPTKDAPGTPWTVFMVGIALESVDSWLIYGEWMFMVNIWLIIKSILQYITYIYIYIIIYIYIHICIYIYMVDTI